MNFKIHWIESMAHLKETVAHGDSVVIADRLPAEKCLYTERQRREQLIILVYIAKSFVIDTAIQ